MSAAHQVLLGAAVWVACVAFVVFVVHRTVKRERGRVDAFGRGYRRWEP